MKKKRPRKPRPTAWAFVDDSGERHNTAWVIDWPMGVGEARALASWLLKFSAWVSYMETKRGKV